MQRNQGLGCTRGLHLNDCGWFHCHLSLPIPVHEADMCGAQAAQDYREHLNLSDAWLLTHRVDLHNALRAAAAKEVNGRRVQIRLASRVATVVGYVAGPAFLQ